MYNNLYGPGNCIDQLRECKSSGNNSVCSTGDQFCANQVESLYDIYLNRDEYDMRELTPDPFPYGFYVAYLNTPKVQAAIGAYVNFSESSNAVGTDFGLTGDDGREVGTIEDVRLLLGDGVTVAMYAGDADYNCNWLGGEKVAEEVTAKGWDSAGYVNLSTSDCVVHGQVKQAGKFSFTRVYESGHEVPFYQPLASLEMFERAIQGLDIATGELKVHERYHTKGDKFSTYREGNSTFQWSVVPSNTMYNVTTAGPGAPWTQKSLKRTSKPRL
jgi:carboxypeptidase D